MLPGADKRCILQQWEQERGCKRAKILCCSPRPRTETRADHFSFCRDQEYWHIQMPSVYCENRSIGWNNTVTGDNVPQRDDLYSSLGFTDSGGFMWLPGQPQSQLLCWFHNLLSSTTFSPKKKGEKKPCTGVPQQPALLFYLLICLSSPNTHTSAAWTSFHSWLPRFHREPPTFTPPPPQPPAWADCQWLRVIRGRFSFIILSKSGTALALGGLG